MEKLDDPEISRRQIIVSLVSSVSINAGFESAELSALDTLAEMFIACLLFKCDLNRLILFD